MKQTGKRTCKLIHGILLMVGILGCMILTGCAATPERVLQKTALTAVSDQTKNYKCESEITMNAQVGNKNLDTGVSMVAELIEKPEYSGHIEMTMNYGPKGKEKNDYYIVKENDWTMMYSRKDNKWIKQLVTMDDLSGELEDIGIYNYSSFLGYQKALTSLSMTEENLDGVDCYKIKGLVDLSQISDQANGILADMGVENTGLDFSTLSTVKMCYWIQKDTYYPIKITMDMKDLMQDIMEMSIKGTRAQGQIKINEAGMEMTFHDFGSVTEIVLPEECKDALLQ